MKKILVLFGLLMAMTLPAQESYLLVGGSGWDQIALIERSTANVVWSHDLGPNQECNGVAVTPNGDILYAYRKGAKLIDLNHNVLWDYQTSTATDEMHTATPLPDGGFLLGFCGQPARLIELDKNGKVRHEMSFDTGIKNEHDQFRQAIKSKKGTYLVPIMGKGIIIEYDKQGKELNQFKAEGNLFSVLERPNGNLIVACGDAHGYVELDRNSGKVLRTINNTNLVADGLEFNFVAQVVPLKNDHHLVANWNGHLTGNQTIQPSLLEMDKYDQLVWQLKENKKIGRISSVAVYPLSKQLKQQLKQSN